MSFFCGHKWEEIARTYAPPIEGMKLKSEGKRGFESLDRMLHGVTTIVFKCSDKECAKLKKIECLGKEIEI